MVVLPNDIRFFYSGGTDNQNPLASLGGQISVTQIINESQENVFNNVTLIEADNGLTDYRCFYVKNVGQELWRNAVIWREQGTQSGFDSIGIGLGTSIIDGTEQIVLDRFTAPINVNFAGPDSKESALLLGDLAPGSHKAIWVRRIVEPLARTFKNNTFKLRVELGNPAGSGGGGGTPPGNPPGLPGTGGGGGTGTGCQTGYHKVNGVCIPDTVPPITGGGGENILWQSTAWSNGHDRTITSHNARDPDDPTLSFGAGENRELIIKGASDPGFVNHTGARTRIYVDQFGTTTNHYNASLEIQKFYINSSLDGLSLRLRSRHNEDDPTTNRFGGYNMSVHHTEIEAQRENYHNDHTSLTPSTISLPHALVNGTEYGIRYSCRDTTDGKVELKMELKGGAYGTSYVEVAKAYDNNPSSYMLDKQLYLNNRSYFWIRTNGDAPEDVRYGFVVFRDLDKSSVTSCPAGYTLKNGVCVADTLPTTQPPPSGGGGATIADYTATAVGDTTCGSTAQTIVSRIVGRNPNFHIPLGDYTYTSSTACWLSMMTPLKSKIFSMNIGNHDDEEDESNTLRSQYLSWVNLSQPYHAFTFRNTFVLTLYTYAPFGFGSGSAQFQFAQQQLAAARANPAIDWIIVNFHKPIYTAASNHSGYTAFRDVYHPLFDQYKVDLCLSGHVHNYQRTKPLKYTGTGTGNSIANNQTTGYINLVNPIFVIAGCGGREISSISDQPSYNAGQREGYGYVLMSWSNNGKKLTCRHYDQTDTLRDEWTMDKTAVSQPPPPPSGGGGTTPPPTTGGQIDSNGIKWLLATGQQSVIPNSRYDKSGDENDFRWSEVYPNLRDNGFEVTAYGIFETTNGDAHFALKHWGGNHSGDCQYSEGGSCCCWYDTGIRENGAVQLQIERPHPSNDDFSATTFMSNIGVGMSNNTIGLKWIIYPIQEGGDVDRGGVKLKMYVDTSGFSASKPQNQWRLVYDITDTGQILGDYPAPEEQEIEVRNSDTNDTVMYGGGIHWRRLSRADINAGGTSGGGGTTPPPSSPAQPPTNVTYYYDSTTTQNTPQTIDAEEYDSTEGIIACRPNNGITSTVISGGYINVKSNNSSGGIYIDYWKKPRFTQDNLPGFNQVVSFSFLYEGQGSITVKSANEMTETNWDNLDTVFGGFMVFLNTSLVTTEGYSNEVSFRARYYDNINSPDLAVPQPSWLGRNSPRTPVGTYPFPAGKTFVNGNIYKVFITYRTNQTAQTVVITVWLDFSDGVGWRKIVDSHTFDRLNWLPGTVPQGYDDTEQIEQGPDLIKRHRIVIRNNNVDQGSNTDLKVKDIKIGTMPYLPDPIITNPPGGGGTTNPPPDDPDPPSGTSGNDANGVKMIYPTKASGDTFLWDLSGSNSRIAGQNVTAVRSTSGGPWAFSKNSTNPFRIYIYTKENSISNINTTQLSTIPPISTFNHNSLATLGYFYQARDWKNIEFTIYFSTDMIVVNDQELPSTQTSFLSLIARSANHTTANGGCGGSSYHADFNIQTGGIRFKKEQYHSSYATDSFTATNIGSSQGRWMGLKFVVWNRSSDGKVEMEIWVDKDATNSWVKYLGKIDADDWGTGAAQCAGTPPGKKITWGSPVTMLKMDVTQTTLFISYLSVREITPPS
jgi:hypothetical protein